MAKNPKKLPISAIDAGVLHVRPAKFYLEKAGQPWIGAGHQWAMVDGEPSLADPPIVDNRAYIEFRGLETDAGRKALRSYVDAASAVDPADKTANDSLLHAAVDLICGMVLSWRLFDEAGDAISLEPGDIDEESGLTQIRILMDHWSEVAPRKLLEMANFLRETKNF